MWINAIAGVVTELDRSGRMAGSGGWLGGGVVLGDLGVVWVRYGTTFANASAIAGGGVRLTLLHANQNASLRTQSSSG